ncbi:hypothetical protein NEOLEDRAFT_1059411 [Neolentinus lepideus HHB14362 ss-1]|uniref:E3 ubiquitin-protein ligase listerin n=1 Tax=Neolentinus lepideus HHB14362 ss-1 TaxID=1314782 RepID=A0A165UDU2_9AGAM|nr:hypothetical protein NEOLEDRAFT_1059411 [Neolentinus lepideus HHB14362 ss-1]
MPKGQKPSATSATKKKHARKTVGPQEPTVTREKKEKGKGKGKNKEPRKKVYIPPYKPPPQPDPLETLGLANRLPPDLLVVLRSLKKKDVVTKAKALEELQSAWIEKALKQRDEGVILSTLVLMLPVWAHHMPALFFSPSRRIRLLAINVHSSLLRIEEFRVEFIAYLHDIASSDQVESVLGTWCMAANDVDRLVSRYARQSWDDFVSLTASTSRLVLDETAMPSLVAMTHRTALDPAAVYLHLNPPHVSVDPVVPARKGGRLPAAQQAKKREEEPSTRAKSDEEEENEDDRKARLRTGALGVLRWVLGKQQHRCRATGGHKSFKDFSEILTNPALWTSLYDGGTAPWADVPSFGHNQPVVRRTAWMLLQSIVGHWKGSSFELFPVISTAVLRSAWVEPDPTVRAVMWQPLMMFLTEFPQAWTVDSSASSTNENDEGSDSEAESGEDDEHEPPRVEKSETPKRSQAYEEFLQFLQLGCSGSPLQGYPTVVIILSTLPPSFLVYPNLSDSLSELFTSFWAAIDGRALSGLDRTASSAAFLSALLECTVFLIKRLRQDPAIQAALQDGPAHADVDSVCKKLVADQSAKVMEELVSERLKVEESAGGSILAKQLSALEQVDEDLFNAAWAPIAATVQGEAAFTVPRVTRFVAVTLCTFYTTFQDGNTTKVATRTLVHEFADRAIQDCRARLADRDVHGSKDTLPIETVLNILSQTIFADAEITANIDEAVQTNVAGLVTTSPSLLLVYLSKRNDRIRSSEVWYRILDVLSGKDTRDLAGTIVHFLEPVKAGVFPDYLGPEDGELDASFAKLLAYASADSSDSSALDIVRKVLQNPKPFLSNNCCIGIIENLTSTFSVHLQQALHDTIVPLEPFARLLAVLQSAFLSNSGAMLWTALSISLFPDLFLFGYLLPRCTMSKDDECFESARSLWKSWSGRCDNKVRLDVQAVLISKLRDIVMDTEVVVTPEKVLDMLWEGMPDLDIHLMDVMPRSEVLRQMLEALPSHSGIPSASVANNLIPPPSLLDDTPTVSPEYDIQGYSQYGRVTTALACIFSSDRQTAKEYIWAVSHLLAASTYAEDEIQLSSERNPFCSQKVSKVELQAFISRVQSIVAYLLVPDTETGWHVKVISSAQGTPANLDPNNPSTFLAHLIRYASGHDNPREARVLYGALQPVMVNASREDADQWIMLARKLEKAAPLTSIAIVSSVTALGPEPPRLDRYRNELAAGVLGTPATNANNEGLLTLMRLAATAPDPDSDVVFLPQFRAVNLMKACQQWIESDEDISEDLESVMTLVFYYLVPILQDVPGGHWDFIFDVTENNLENCSFNDESTLMTLARTLRLVITIQDLAVTNKSLRALWEEHRQSVLILVRDVVSSRQISRNSSRPQSICLELAMTIIQDLPESLLDDKTLPSMCRLLLSTSPEAQKMAYQLLQESSRKYTENLVIEAGVDTEANVQCELPAELIDILQRGICDEDDYLPEDAFGYFLAWMALFDLFANASFKVKTGYIQHLRSLDIISSKFIPYVFNALGLYGGPRSTFRLDLWAVDEYYISLCDPETPFSVPLQAAHLYYRSLLIVPSLIRSWLQECKDRTLSTTVTTFTAQHYSPVIVATEFARLKSPDAASELDHENLSIKVAAAVNEVTASWAVDDYGLEISLKLPADWPLHPIQVRDSKKVGVGEDRWRAWVLGVQQIICFQNGSIVDGLSLFKRNVSLHFEGQVECAICYSIISPMDYSLPKKPCKTCKNRFHSTCLYKWFNTSHSSTCPLCRSEIF